MDLKLDNTTWDLVFDDDGLLVKTTPAEQVRQHIIQRILTQTGEWAFDTTAGLPYLETIMGKGVPLTIIEGIIKSEVLRVTGVTSIKSATLTLSPTTRALSVALSVNTDYGLIDINIGSLT